MNKDQKAEQIVRELFNNNPHLNTLDMQSRLAKREALFNKAKENLIDKSGENDWNVAEVYKSLEMSLNFENN